MKNLFFLIVSIFIAVSVNAQTTNTTSTPKAPNTTPAAASAPKVADPNAPVIVFTDDSHDFGEITQGDKVTCDFVFKNTGKTDLVLQNVKASCGCTTPYWPKEPVKPGQSSKISAQFNSTGKSGPFTKQITITSNASDPTTHVTIKGKINVPVQNDGVPERKSTMVMEK